MKRLDKVAAKNHPSVSGVKKGHVGGDVETEDTGEEGEAFVKFVNKAKVRHRNGHAFRCRYSSFWFCSLQKKPRKKKKSMKRR
jgi:hypothetical protein